MDETGKKRKATLSPINESRSPPSENACQVGISLNNYHEEGTSRNKLRSRTPSGTDLKNCVRDIRPFFGHNGGKPAKFKNSQRISVTGRKSVTRNLTNKPKTRYASLSASQNKRQKVMTKDHHDEREQLHSDENNSEWEYATESDDQESVLTPEQNTVNNKHEGGDHKMKPVTNKKPSSPLKHKNVQSVLQKATESAANRNMEFNDNENPSTMQVSTVLKMFHELKKEMSAARKNDTELLHQELLTFKKTCVETASEEINKVIGRESEVIQCMRSDLKLLETENRNFN